MNNKKRTGEIWNVKYSKIKGFINLINQEREYTFKICRSWKCSNICGDHFQYKGKILKSSDSKDEIGKICHIGHFFGNPNAKYHQLV
ncbi:MAG: hypothetical protein WC554_16470 [Clostridia bacterium]|jgi:hypothetical protein